MARERSLDRLMIEMADRASAFRVRVVMVPDVAERGRDDEKAHESQWHHEIASISAQGHAFTAGHERA